ncbi:MAG: uracil-DNA glycosylase [Anaerolineales bacterium]|nr:uracil-DNA glycosylase [Anaerolineales bacterium]MBX3037593.1 uracil-DNA glycosylase [Anaerolineales bacterium]
MTKQSQLEKLNQQIISCRKCPRLVEWREEVARVKRKAYINEEYWGKPVPGFGDENAKVLVVGLAPGAHGSNRTGRNFTGDASGNFLFPALHRAGFANQAEAESRSDALRLKNMYITASGRCAPPDNKPTLEELNNCQPYLETELKIINPKVIVCLGRIAFERILKIYGVKNSSYKFSHGVTYKLNTEHWILCSYHPSQQNTSTKKLTAKMFDEIWAKAKELIDKE